jgi:hypothetical protein
MSRVAGGEGCRPSLDPTTHAYRMSGLTSTFFVRKRLRLEQECISEQSLMIGEQTIFEHRSHRRGASVAPHQ